MDLGELEAADLTVTTDYATAYKLFVEQDQAAGMQAFMAGKVKVQGDMMKMMAMQTSMPQDEIAKTIAKEIKDAEEDVADAKTDYRSPRRSSGVDHVSYGPVRSSDRSTATRRRPSWTPTRASATRPPTTASRRCSAGASRVGP